MFPHQYLTPFLTLITAFISLTPISVKCARLLLCDSDADCQDGYSCIENTCKICIKCSLIFRRGNNCESDFNACGDCLKGYKEISVTDNSAVKKPCKPIKKRGNLKECATDNNCPPDNYCDGKSCVKCFDCSLINRLKPEKCARDPNECGPCFTGYLSTSTKSGTNYNNCTKVLPDHMPYNIATGSVFFASLICVGIAIAGIVKRHRKYGTGLESSNSISRPADGLHPLCCVWLYNNHTQQSVVVVREVQQAKVYEFPRGDARSNEISEPGDSGPSVPDQPTSAQREETTLSYGSGIHGECARSRSSSEVNSINSVSDSQGEQSVDVNALNNESAGNNSHLVAHNPAEVPEDPAKEATEDVPLYQG